VACNPTNLSTRANADVLLLSLLFFFKQKMSSIRILVLHYQWWARDSLLSVCVLSSIYIEVNPHTSRVLSSQIDTVLTWLVKVTSVNAKQRTFVFVTSLAFDVLQLEIKSEYNNIRAGIMGTVTQYKRMGWIEVLPTAARELCAFVWVRVCVCMYVCVCVALHSESQLMHDTYQRVTSHTWNTSCHTF